MATTLQETQDLSVPFPERMSRRWLRVSITDILVVTLLYFGRELVSRRYGNLSGDLFGLGALGLITPVLYGRVYTYVTIVGEWYVQFVLQDVLWQADDHGFRARARRLLGEVPNPGAITPIGNTLATLYNKERGTDTVVIFGEGSPVLGLSWEDQARYYFQIESMIKQLAASESLSLGIGWRICQRPINIHDLDDRAFMNVHPEVLAPLALDPPKLDEDLTEADRIQLLKHELMLEFAEVEITESADYVMALVLTIRRTPVLRRAARKGNLPRMESEPIVRLARHAETALGSQGVRNPRIAQAADLRDYIRQSRDVFTLHEYYALDEEARKTAYGPQQKIVVKHNSCCIDGTWHAVLTITGGPEQIPIWGLRSLFSTDVDWFSYSSPSEARGWRGEYTLINNVLIPMVDMARGGLGITRSGEAGTVKAAQRVERQRRLYHTRWAQHINIFLGVSAATEEELDDQCGKLEAVIRTNNFDFSRISGRLRMLRAVYSATTCCNLL